MKRCLRVEIRGRVTGVGFRYSALRRAGQFPGLRGYVLNADSRTVECLLQGEAEDVAAMLRWLRQGPPSARVTDVTAEEQAVREDLGAFSIR